MAPAGPGAAAECTGGSGGISDASKLRSVPITGSRSAAVPAASHPRMAPTSIKPCRTAEEEERPSKAPQATPNMAIKSPRPRPSPIHAGS